MLRRRRRVKQRRGHPPSFLHRVEQGRQRFFRAVDQYNESCPPPYDLKLRYKQRQRNAPVDEDEDEDGDS